MDIKINVTIDDKQLSALPSQQPLRMPKQPRSSAGRSHRSAGEHHQADRPCPGCADHANETNIVECAGTVRTERDIVDDRCKEQNQKIKDLILKVAGLEATISNPNIELEDAKREKVFAENLVKYPTPPRATTGAPMRFDAEQPHDPPATALSVTPTNELPKLEEYREEWDDDPPSIPQIFPKQKPKVHFEQDTPPSVAVHIAKEEIFSQTFAWRDILHSYKGSIRSTRTKVR